MAKTYNSIPLRHSGERPGFGRDLPSDLFKFQRVAIITRVDYEKGFVDVEYLNSVGSKTNIILPAAFSSPRGSIHGMPEEGSIVIVGFSKQDQKLEDPIIIGFSDIDLENTLQYYLTRNDRVPQNLTEIKTIREKIGYNSVRAKRKKIYPGEIQAESTQGSEIYLDDSVYLSNSRLNEIEIVSSDQSIRMSSLQQYSQTQSARTWNGMVTRIPISDTELQSPTIFPNGQKAHIVTESTNPYHLGGKPLTEYRIEIVAKSDGIMKVTGVNANSEVDIATPNIIFVLGTNVGNDQNDVQHYAKVLKPTIFSSPDTADTIIGDVECLPEEYNSLASTFQLKFDSGAKIDIDKQGHLFSSFPASTAQNSLGAGRSWEANFDGSVKWVVGLNAQKHHSIIIDTKGSIRETLGFELAKQRSKETIAQKGIYIEVLAPDLDGNAYLLKTVGNVDNQIDGNYNINVTGNYTITAAGKIQENIMGVKVENYINDKNNVIGGSKKEVIMSTYQSKIGASRDVTIAGNDVPPKLPADAVDSLTILNGSIKNKLLLGNVTWTLLLGDEKHELTAGNITDKLLLGNRNINVITGNINESITTGNRVFDSTTGNLEENLKLGSKKVKVITGDINESITAGNRIVNINAGNFEVAVLAGKVKVSTKVGNVDVDALSGEVTINGMLQVTLKSGVTIKHNAPTVSIGMMPSKGAVVTGVPGIPTHLDFITGLPLRGSATVSSSI